jgi:hypothetical protein
VAAPAMADTCLSRAVRQALKRVAQFVGGAFVLVAVEAALSWPTSGRLQGVIWGLVGAFALISFAYALTAIRAQKVRTSLGHGCLRVLAVGWTRSPDGCNFAVFPPDADPAISEPALVVRLATIRSTMTGHALLAGELRRGKAVAIFTPGGEVLAVGRVRGDARAQRVWARRKRKTPWWSASSGRDSPPSV